MKQRFMADLHEFTKHYEDCGLGGLRIWVARDANGCLYSYTNKPEWDEETRRWKGGLYGTFTFDAYPWVMKGMCVGFYVESIEKEAIE